MKEHEKEKRDEAPGRRKLLHQKKTENKWRGREEKKKRRKRKKM